MNSYMDIGARADGGYKAVVVAAVLIVMQVLMVAGRFLSRRLQKLLLGPDDYVLLSAMVLTVGLCALGSALPRIAGVGQHTELALIGSPATAKMVGQSSIAWLILYAFSITLSKCAILLLYVRVFTTRMRAFTVAVYLVGFVVVSTGVAIIFVTIFQCSPAAYEWNKTIQGGTCINQVAFARYMSISNVLTGFVMLLMPLPLVWKLNITVQQKIALTATFFHGIIGFIASCVRLSILFQSNTMMGTTSTAISWTILTLIEPANYVIAACLPTLRPILTRILPEQFSLLSKQKSSADGISNTNTKSTVSTFLEFSWPRGQALPKLSEADSTSGGRIGGPWDGESGASGEWSPVDVDVDVEKGKGIEVRVGEV